MLVKEDETRAFGNRAGGSRLRWLSKEAHDTRSDEECVQASHFIVDRLVIKSGAACSWCTSTLEFNFAVSAKGARRCGLGTRDCGVIGRGGVQSSGIKRAERQLSGLQRVRFKQSTWSWVRLRRKINEWRCFFHIHILSYHTQARRSFRDAADKENGRRRPRPCREPTRRARGRGRRR